jgi:single-stranded DNA-specific DHH superfamily exonuclease
MELVTFLLGLAAIVGTGALTKVGENITDSASPKIQRFFGVIQSKLLGSKTAKALEAGQELDYDQTIIDLEPIESDPELLKLADEIRSLIAQNQSLQAKLDAEVAKIRTKNSQINRDKSQANQFNAPIQNLTINQTSNPD